MRPVDTYRHYVAILVLLFIAIATHLGTNWSILRNNFISHNGTRNIMAQASLGGLNPVDIPADVAAFMAIWLGDVLLISIGISHILDLVPGTLMLLSLGTTVLATSLIIYRIYIVSKDSGNGSDRYNFTMEVLAESGAMYAATLLVVCVFLITPGTTFNAAPSNISFWVGVVTPMAPSSSHNCALH
ncbi:hypothetical protein D9619_003918 [Psilocybe cf. subviscida]|uniref:Uncharacterized protein n=1 Tax=Psilocybe cf. subviscida TaxID=2480587 RepID=A0A8H5BQC5_9AGAR|nr:hypothetical protein D9619_003918 [Psilocybe cf. subviscida]